MHAGAQSLGVCYGGNVNAKNLPPESEVVSLCKTYGIGRMRIYSPYPEILQALRDSYLEIMVGVPNDSLQALLEQSAAADWVQRNIKDYSSDVKFKYIRRKIDKRLFFFFFGKLEKKKKKKKRN